MSPPHHVGSLPHSTVLQLSINLCPRPPQVLANHVFIVTIVVDFFSSLPTHTYTQAKVEFCLSKRDLVKISSSQVFGLLTLPLKVGELK